MYLWPQKSGWAASFRLYHCQTKPNKWSGLIIFVEKLNRWPDLVVNRHYSTRSGIHCMLSWSPRIPIGPTTNRPRPLVAVAFIHCLLLLLSFIIKRRLARRASKKTMGVDTVATSFAKTEGVQRMFFCWNDCYNLYIFQKLQTFKNSCHPFEPSPFLPSPNTTKSYFFNFCNHAWEQCIDAMQEIQKGSLQKRVSAFSNKLLTCSFLSFANLYIYFISRALVLWQTSYLRLCRK